MSHAISRRRSHTAQRRSTAVVLLLVAALAGPLLLPSAAVPASPGAAGGRHGEPTFSDVPDDHLFHDDIMWMAEGGYVTGYADGTYQPERSLSRQELVQLLWRMSGEPQGPFPDEQFSDVGPNHPFITAIEWSVALDVVGGYSDGTFRGHNTITRQTLGALLHRLSGITSSYGSVTFDDVALDHPFQKDISWWYMSRQADGYTDNTFRPVAPVTRGSVARFLTRFYDMMGGYWPFVDHHTHEALCAGVTPTAEQQAIADQLLADVEATIPVLFPTRAAAEAAGYRYTAPAFAGEGVHLVHDDYSQDGIMLDPTKPESLVVDANGVDIAAAMFVREHMGSGATWPPEPAGCITLWHAHDNLCYTSNLLDPTAVVNWIAGFGGSRCPEGTMVRVTPEMLHVWRDEFWDGGPFDGIHT